MVGSLLADLDVLSRELTWLRAAGFLSDPNVKTILDYRCSIVNPWDIILDRMREYAKEGKHIGSTGRGMGPAMEARARRKGVIRIGMIENRDLADRLEEAAEEPLVLFRYYLDKVNSSLPSEVDRLTTRSFIEIARENSKGKIDLTKYLGTDGGFDFGIIAREYKRLREGLDKIIGDGKEVLHEAEIRGDNVLVEGNQGAILDVNHGVPPYITASNALATSIASNAGIPRVDLTINVAKALESRVGNGPFVTRIADAREEDELRDIGGEFGTTTGRGRKLGHLDIPKLRYAVRMNGGAERVLALMKLDTYAGRELKVVTSYRDKSSDPLLEQPISEFPDDNSTLELLRPHEVLEFGPLEDIRALKRKEELTGEAKRFIDVVEGETKIPVKMVGNSADFNGMLI